MSMQKYLVLSIATVTFIIVLTILESNLLN
jgi:hypothetical protein